MNAQEAAAVTIETEIKGQSVQSGIAIGPVFAWCKKKPVIVPDKSPDPDAEWDSFCKAREEAIGDLQEMGRIAEEKLGEEQAMIFSVHEMLLLDADFEDAVSALIRDEHFNASYAVHKAGRDLADFFAAMEDNDYMRERAADFQNIADRVIAKLQYITETPVLPDEPVIFLADDLSPSETIGLDTTKILAFVTAGGSVQSHTAILARSLGLPTIVHTGIAVSEEYDGREGIVDGRNGCFYVDPSAELLSRMKEEQRAEEHEKEELKQLIGQKAVTGSGKSIRLYANAAGVEDVERALTQDAEGIGLFRSEFLYLGREDYPTEDEQFESYKEAAQLMQGKEVIIRTLDIGADKQAGYFGIEKEENPALGLRAIRICLTRPEIFVTQLRAIYRASAFGTVSIMFPMITSVEEVDRILEITEEVKAALSQEGIPTGEVKLGIMIETPAAALISDLLAEKVDFFSIGTNDLTQYTLAMDRQNAALSEFMNPYHEALKRLIEMTVKNAHEKNTTVGICGELGADPKMTAFFLSVGVDELSVSASRILALKKQIREM